MSQHQPQFSTTSIDVAAFLLASGVKFLGYKRKDPISRRLTFLFPADAEALVAQYYAGMEVAGIRFWGEIKRLKSIVFEESNN